VNNLSLYLITVLIWGSTWIAITFQLGEVNPLVSVAYRFGLASILLLIFCYLFKKPMKFSAKDHLFIFLQGNFLFGLNYWLMYLTTARISSGLVAVMFASIVFLNIINGRIFLGKKIQLHVLFAACIGMVGIALVFWPEVSSAQDSGHLLEALVFGFGATYFASLGNIISSRNQSNKIPVLQTNAIGMAYGSICMIIVAMSLGLTINVSTEFDYLASLLYLSIFGSIVAFSSYLTLVGRIGADKAGYASLLFPVIALQLSAWFENFEWTALSLVGLSLVLIGNLLVMVRPSQTKKTILGLGSILSGALRPDKKIKSTVD